MTYKIRHRLIRWLARGDRVDLNRPMPTYWSGMPNSTTYKFDGVEWFRV